MCPSSRTTDACPSWPLHLLAAQQHEALDVRICCAQRKAKEQDAEAAGDPAPAVADAPGAKRPKRERKAAAPPASDSTASEEEAQAAPSKAKAKAPRKRAAKKSAEPAADGAEGQEDAEAGSSKCAPLNVTGLWLMKNEPDELSLESLKEKPDQTAYWDGEYGSHSEPA